MRHSYQQKSITFTYNMGRPHVVYGHVCASGAEAMPAKEHTVVRKRAENGKRMNNAKNMRNMEESSTARPSRLFCCCKMCFLCCKGTVSGPGGCLCICPSIQNRNMCESKHTQTGLDQVCFVSLNTFSQTALALGVLSSSR